jgi:hypothetical protein
MILPVLNFQRLSRPTLTRIGTVAHETASNAKFSRVTAIRPHLQGREFTPGVPAGLAVPLIRLLHGKQAVVLFFYHRITLATTFFQRCPVEHRDVPAHVLNHSRVL